MNKKPDTLILHIGLPKAGSKLLQTRVFETFDDVSTLISSDEWKKIVATELFRLIYQHNSSIWNTIEGEKYCSRLKNILQNLSGKSFLISHEGLIMHMGFLLHFWDYEHEKQFLTTNNIYTQNVVTVEILKDFLENLKSSNYPNFLLSYHLKEILSVCPWISKIKIILVLRNQTEWLCSYYTELSNFYPERASQEDFTQRIQRLLQDKSLFGGGFLNWGKMVRDIANIVGKENVSVLLLEESGLTSFWETIAEGSDLSINIETLVSDNRSIHDRKIDSRTWPLRNCEHFLFSNLGYRLIRQFFNPIWPYLKKCFLFPVGYKTALSLDNFGRRKLELTDEVLVEEIRTYCRPFNQELAEFLGRDYSELVELGY